LGANAVLRPYLFTTFLAISIVLVGCSKDTSAPVDPDTLEYFLEIALGIEYGERPDPVLERWASDWKIYIGGDPSTNDLNCIDSINQRIARLTKLKIIEVEEISANISIFFVPEREFGKRDPYYPPGNIGYFGVYTEISGEIVKAIIQISSEDPEKERCHAIAEELSQITGLYADSFTKKTSLFFQGFSNLQTLSKMDELIMQLLYDKRLEIGMVEEEIRTALKN
jgi:hypothetical protein